MVKAKPTATVRKRTVTATAKASQAAAKGAKQIHAAAQTVAPAIDKAGEAIKASQQSAATIYQNGLNDFKQQTTKVQDTMANNFDDINQTFQNGVNAITEAGNTITQSIEDISKAWFALCQTSFESNINATKSALSAKNAHEAFDIQTNAAKENFDTIVAESTKISQIGIDAATKAFEPIQTAVNQSVEQATQQAENFANASKDAANKAFSAAKKAA